MSIRRSLFIQFLNSYSGTAIAFVSVVILARLLTPQEIGVFSVCMAFVGFLHTLRDFGIGAYLLQERHLDKEILRSAYGLALLFAWSAGGILALSSGAVADFFHEPGVRSVTLVLALNFLLIPLGSLAIPLLKRDMHFISVMKINLAVSVAYAVSTIVFAALGFGYMSMAWGTLAGTVVNVIASLAARPDLIGIRPSLRHARRILSFGMYSVGSNLIVGLGPNGTEIVIGRMLGFDAVAMLGKGRSLITLFQQAIMAFILPVAGAMFARNSRNGDDVGEPFLRVIGYLTAVGWPCFIFMGFMAFPMIDVLFGSQWYAAVPVAQIFCFAYCIALLHSLNNMTLEACGRAKEAFHLQLILYPPTILLVIAAAPFGLLAVAGTTVISATAGLILSYRFLGRVIHICPAQIARAVWKSALVAAISSVPPMIVYFRGGIGPDNALLPLIGTAVMTGLVWLAAIFATGHEIRHEVVMLLRNCFDQMRRVLRPAV
jgi:O-antigen/teichoic acid export membrane protein